MAVGLRQADSLDVGGGQCNSGSIPCSRLVGAGALQGEATEMNGMAQPECCIQCSGQKTVQEYKGKFLEVQKGKMKPNFFLRMDQSSDRNKMVSLQKILGVIFQVYKYMSGNTIYPLIYLNMNPIHLKYWHNSFKSQNHHVQLVICSTLQCTTSCRAGKSSLAQG